MTLSDTQSILLITAARRPGGSLLPLPDGVTPGGGTSKALAALLRKGLAEERPINAPALAHRSDGDLHYGAFITIAGAAAISLESEQLAGIVAAPATLGASAPAPAASAKSPTKVAVVVGLMQRPAGATLPELIEATGWLQHTTRAALTGLRKKGHVITRGKRDGVTAYTIAARA